MRTKNVTTFSQILREEAPRNARRLETKARTASWIAKIEPKQAGRLYSIKHDAVSRLFRIEGQAPTIRDAWSSPRGYLVLVRLSKTRSFLHVPFDQLRMTTQQAYAGWVSARAHGRWWKEGQLRQPLCRRCA